MRETLAMKPGSFGRIVRRFHQVPDCFKQGHDFLVMSLDSFFQFNQFRGEFLVRAEHFAQLHERTHEDKRLLQWLDKYSGHPRPCTRSDFLSNGQYEWIDLSTQEVNRGQQESGNGFGSDA